MSTINTDANLQLLLNSLNKGNEDYWSFRGKSTREHAHAYLQYPAMMVPQMQGELLSAIKEVAPDTKSVYDPFVGSGTVMTEAMIRGLDFTGNDINPLAVLICQAKKGPFFVQALDDKITTLINTIRKDRGSKVEIDFDNIDKWFRKDVAIELSRIRRAIQNEKSRWSRRLFWLALAETIRLTSNSRTSTYKLHIRPKEEVENRQIFPIKTFEEIIGNIYANLHAIKKILEQKGFIKHGYYQGTVKIRLTDSTVRRDNGKYNELHDLLVTSPPYGDNATTVPYGQYSYLPLQWIDFKDIAGDCDNSWITTTHEIDKRSLGGTKAKALDVITELRRSSQALDQTLKALENEPQDRAVRVAAFYRDLNASLDSVLAELKPNACMVWTIGNRRVADKLVPMDDILSELLIIKGARIIARFQRRIPFKRAAVKNNIAATMSSETVLVMEKGDSK